MAFIVRTAKTLRNHWKKSTFASLLLLYGYNYTRDYLETRELMRVYCEKAAKYGDQTIPIDVDPKTVTVILNPNANKRKANDEFEKYCAPILHLAGFSVNIIKTESEGHAKTLINDISNTDAIVIGGGDGTLSEVITGLLRRTEENTNGLIPIGVLPLGQTNSIGKRLFLSRARLERVQLLADAAMAIVEDVKKPINVLKIEVLDENQNKPIYAASGIKWGAYRDAESKKDSYWIYGSLRRYATYLFNGYKSSLSWKCDATLNYTPPCGGCSNCIKAEPPKKWFQKLSKSPQNNSANILNPECLYKEEKEMSTVDFNLSVVDDGQLPKMKLCIGPKSISYLDFVKEGWKTVNEEERNFAEKIEARTVEIIPKNKSEAWFSIDNENFELKPIKITLLLKLINVFCKKENL